MECWFLKNHSKQSPGCSCNTPPKLRSVYGYIELVFNGVVIADSVETVVAAHWFDGMVCIPNCDKITPGMIMGALRVNIPTVFVSGGPMRAGKDSKGRSISLNFNRCPRRCRGSSRRSR